MAKIFNVNNIDKQFTFNAENIAELKEKQSQGFDIPRHMKYWYKGETDVRKAGCIYAWTQHELDEFTKCSLDIQYFANNYCKIKSDDGQIRQMKLRDYQYDVLDAYFKTNRCINCSSRQSGKTICASILILMFCSFNKNKNVMIVANKKDTVIEIIDKIKSIYKLLPFFMQQGIKSWNTTTIVFENGCRIKCQARSKSPAIGYTIDLLYMDEFAHIPSTIINPYYRAVYPTVSSIKGSKIIITSTPNGANLFKDLYTASSLPAGHPEKGPYKIIKVYWYQVPDGKFEDGTNGTRLDARLYYDYGDFKKYNIEHKDVKKYLDELGFKTAYDTAITDNGIENFIRILHEENKSDINIIRNLKYNKIELSRLFRIENWKEIEIKGIGGEENFNQEYGLQFLAGSKRVLSSIKAQELEKRLVRYNHIEIETLSKRLQFVYDELRFAPDYIEKDRNNFYWLTTIDVSEGLGQDDSVFNLFRLVARDREWLETNKIKNIWDAFYLKQTAIWNYNRLDHKSELGELFYLLHFEYLNPERCKVIVEYNGPGMAFLSSLSGLFGSVNNYGSFIFSRFKHSHNAEKKQIGIKLHKNKKELVKAYIDAIEKDKVYVDEDQTLNQMDNFIKVETRSGDFTYKADSGHDDIVITNIYAAHFTETSDYRNMCMNYYNELSKEYQDLIQKAQDLNYNPGTFSLSGLSNLIKNNNQKFNIPNNFNNI